MLPSVFCTKHNNLKHCLATAGSVGGVSDVQALDEVSVYALVYYPSYYSCHPLEHSLDILPVHLTCSSSPLTPAYLRRKLS